MKTHTFRYQKIQDLRSPRTARSEFRSHAKRLDIVKFPPAPKPVPESHETPWIVAMFAIGSFLLAARLMWLL
ncbi:hypothetical protein EAH75_01290 [Rhodanobacter glycinis]|uniref:hypothetical protein n=1 Tax=Rhodanobacter glycinis TaxID=582702 RepID=UPI00112EE52B|nr:hypothetical protein [Rhodanobacter glycinis]TPG50160.1 hypothetical protein EAH75_01290 [Rhodanobacter glycinis]